MTRPRQNGFSLLTATGLIGLAGWGAVMGAVPELTTVPDPWAAAPLAVLGAAAWLRRRRDDRVADRLRDLRISVRLPMPPTGLRDEELVFRPAGRNCWRACRGGWQAELRQVDTGPLHWQFGLARLDHTDPVLPLATTASLGTLLHLSRGLLPGMDQPGLGELLDCDLSFPLVGLTAGEAGITALAEGGFALRDRDGSRAIGAEQAEALLLRGSALVAH